MERSAISYEVVDKASEWRPGGREIMSHIDNESTSIPGKQTNTQKTTNVKTLKSNCILDKYK